MKLKIMHKLLILVSLPIITLILFSLTHIDAKYTSLVENKMYISKLHVMEQTSNLLHELQVERGASLSYMDNVDKLYFTPLLNEQKNKTDRAIAKLIFLIQKIDTKLTSQSSKKYIQSLKKSFKTLKNIRYSIYNSNIEASQVFSYYTQINKQLLSLLTVLDLHQLLKKHLQK